jgi:hypothetical protein
MAKMADLATGVRVFVRNYDPGLTTLRLYGNVVRLEGRKAIVQLDDGRTVTKDCSSLEVKS